MQFHTFAFAIFFAATCTIYWLLPRHRWRLTWLLAASCLFYMSWNPWLILLILFSASVDYLAARWLEHEQRPRLRRAILVTSITINLSLLAFFKYANFFLNTTCSALNFLGLSTSHPALQIILPLAISFYTFETISYVVDVYQRKLPAVRNLLDYSLFIMFFPHLVAGPIVRPRDFLPQLQRTKRFSWNRFQLGAQFFLLGLIKKAIIADHLAASVDPVFANPASYGSATIWLAVLGYSAQIFCDFSGYSDMAIGVAHAFGFKLPMNFNMPYLSANIAEFWRRWHISLSSWLRDYLYVPLGGSRHGSLATYRNLMLTMLLGGLWHGASWTFVAWGLYHGLLLALHRAVKLPDWAQASLLRPVAVLGTFLSVTVGWVFFRAQTFTDAALILERMVWPIAGQSLPQTSLLIASTCLLAVLAGHLVGRFVDLERTERRLPAAVLGAALAFGLLLVQFLLPLEGKTFIYFQF